jgi:hypothetical protein
LKPYKKFAETLIFCTVEKLKLARMQNPSPIVQILVVLFAHRTKVPAMFVPVDATVINLPLSALTSV